MLDHLGDKSDDQTCSQIGGVGVAGEQWLHCLNGPFYLNKVLGHFRSLTPSGDGLPCLFRAHSPPKLANVSRHSTTAQRNASNAPARDRIRAWEGKKGSMCLSFTNAVTLNASISGIRGSTHPSLSQTEFRERRSQPARRAMSL